MVDRSIYLTSDAANRSLLSQQIHSNNLANSKTVGFKADQISNFKSVLDYSLDESAVYAMNDSTVTSMQSGQLIQTKRSLDVAVKGEGFFVVQTDDGGRALTRNGQFHLNANRELSLESGELVLSDGGPVTLPEGIVEINQNGQIKVLNPENSQEIFSANLLLANPDSVTKRPDGFLKPVAGEIAQDLNVQIEQGYVEDSNVNSVTEMIAMLSESRNFEMNMNYIDYVKENDVKSSSLLNIQP